MKLEQHRIRLSIIIVFFAIFGLILLARLYSLTVWNRAFLLHQGDARSLRTLIIPSFRGMIVDRLGEPLAVSTPLQSIWVNPKVFQASKLQRKKIAELLEIDLDTFNKKLTKHQNKEFLYLKRQILFLVKNFL